MDDGKPHESQDKKLPHRTVMTIAEDADGRSLFGTLGGGVLNYDGQTFHAIRLEKSASMNTIELILCDSQGYSHRLVGYVRSWPNS